MGDYTNVPYKLYNKGLNVALPADIIGESQYTRLTNVRNRQEGQIVSRYGLIRTEWGTDCGWVVFMRKLNDNLMMFILSDGQVFVNGDHLLIYDDILGVGNRTGTAEVPNPETGTIARFPLVLTDVRDIAVIKFTNSFAGEDWAFFGTADGMWKIDKLGRAYKWGIRPPFTTSIDVTSGEAVYTPTLLKAALTPCPADKDGHFGCGLGLGTTALLTPYKWVYTYFNSRTGSESNPCAEMDTQVTGILPTIYNGSTLIQQGQGVKLTGFVEPTDPQVDRLRIYRFGGSLNEYILEQEVPWDTVEFTSFRGDNEIASSQILSFDNDVPFTSLVPASEQNTAEKTFVEKPDEFGITHPLSLFETAMGRCWGPFAGSYIFGAGDQNRPSVVYWTNQGNPDGAGDTNSVQVCANAEPIQNGFVFGGNAFVFTRDNLYALDWGGPTAVPAFVPRIIPQGMGLSAPEALAVGTQGVFFLSKDGVYITDCTSFCESVTLESMKPIFLGQAASIGDVDVEDPEFFPFDWDGANETYMTIAAQELHFLYWSQKPGGERVRVHLVYDILNKRWQRFKAANFWDTAYVYGVENVSKYTVYMALGNGKVYLMSDGGEDVGPKGEILDFETGDQISDLDIFTLVPFHCQFRTGAGDLGQPLTHKEFGVLMVDGNSFGKDITITPKFDAETMTGDPFVFNTPERQVKTFSLEDVYFKNVSFDFSWDGKASINQITLQARIDEEETVHWEHPDTSLHIPGWKHVRDLYLGLRTTDELRLRIEIDGRPYDYLIPSTSGKRRKVYVKCDPAKGKVYRVILDSEYILHDNQTNLDVQVKHAPFRFYKDDSYLYVKPWHTGNTYTKVQMGGEGGAF